MTATQRIVFVGIVAALAGFAIGALWQYSSARGYAGRFEEADRALHFQRLEATLGAATIEAQRGSHEIARQLASDFFTSLQSGIGRATPLEQEAFNEILRSRDGVITALSRGDPESGNLLAQLFVRYRIALGEPVS